MKPQQGQHGRGRGGGKGKQRPPIHTQLRRERREQRQRERFIATPTPRQANRLAGQMARTEFNPVLRGIKGDIGGSLKREGDISNWYGQLSDASKEGIERAAQGNAANAQAITTQLANAQAADAAGLAAQQTKATELAKLLGNPSNAGSQLGTAAAGNASLAQQRIALFSPIGREGTAYTNYLGQRRTGVIQRGIEAHGEETARRRKLKEDLQAGRRERGEKKNTYLQKLREQAQEEDVKLRAFGSKEGYNKALEKQSELGFKSTKVTARATIAAANAARAARERGASAQEVVAAEQKAAARVTGKAQENTARIQGKNSSKGGYSVKEAEALFKQSGESFASVGEGVDYLVRQGVKYGTAKKAVHGIYSSAKRQRQGK